MDVDASPTSTQEDSSHSKQKDSSLNYFSTIPKQVADAEIRWALNCVAFQFLASSSNGMNELFKSMFSDSEIVSYYSMSESKYRYITSFGIGPYFAKTMAVAVKNHLLIASGLMSH